MSKLSPKLASLRDKVRAHARYQIKTADSPEAGQDSTFEQSFSNLAHAYLKEKAPSLLDYEVGFQLLDRNQEDSKAVGVFGFKVGQQWLYAPVFFIAGDFKGHELLYIKNQDMFVPLKENWLNYILNRKPNVLGTSVDKNLRNIGVMPPNLSQLSRSPSKYASWSGWVKEAMPVFAHIATSNPGKDPKYKNIRDLPTFLKEAGTRVVRSLIAGFQENPKFALAFDSMHGLKLIDDVLLEIKEQQEKSAAIPSVMSSGPSCKNTPNGVRCVNKRQAPRTKSVMSGGANEVNAEPGDLLKSSGIGDPIDPAVTYAGQEDLKVYTYDDVLEHGTGLEGLTDKERSKLLKDKVLIKDKRPKAQTAYEVTSPVRIQNPSETGLFDVLVKSNKFEKCLIIFAPYSQRERKDFVTLVRVDDDGSKGKAWLNIHPANIWIGHQYTNEEYQKWWDKLPEAKDLPVSKKGLHILIGNTGEGSLPFTVDEEVSDDSRKIYDVYFKSYAEKERPGNLPPINTRLMHYRGAYDHPGNGRRIQFTGKRGARLRATGEDLYVPSDYRLLTLRPAAADDDDSFMGCCGCDSHSDPSPIQPGNQLDIDFLLGTKTASLKLYDTGTEIEINGNRMQKLAALIYLVRHVHLREKQARIILERAASQKVARFRVKKAGPPYELQQSGPSSPDIPEQPTGYDPMTGGQVPTTNPGEWNLKIPDMSASNTDRSIYSPIGPDPDYQQPAPDHATQQSAMQAAQTGQKEVFDTSMIGGLLKTVRNDNMVDKYMGDLVKGLDRLGRILFLFYWHGDKFEDRYGKGDMTELEDGLRNSFEYLGDIVLFLKQRSVDAGNDGVDLSELSG